MKILLWIANEPNQKALANKLHAAFPLAGIITESRKHKRKFTVAKLFEKAIEKIFLPEISHSWWRMKKHYDKLFPAYPAVPTIDVENINSDEAFDFSTKINADLILVSGTRLVKEKMFLVNPSIGILNLHTGLSPYIKGGPNCTNWCVATGQYHLIGNTIMWIDKGIDSGNIFSTAFTPLQNINSLSQLHIAVMEHAHDLYLQSIEQISKQKLQNVKQTEIANGKTFYNKEWGLVQKIKLVTNFKHFRKAVANGDVIKMQKSIKVISLSNINR